jgi:predicted transcriptional regulator
MSWERATRKKRWWVAFDKTGETDVATGEHTSRKAAIEEALQKGVKEENIAVKITRSKTIFDTI